MTEQPTCAESGTAEIRCSRCGRVREAEIAAAGHDYVTCEEGIEVCSRCKEALSGEEYHKPFLWLIVVICAGAAIIAAAIVLGYKSFRKAKAREEETSGDEENNDENGDEDADGEDEDS